MDSFNNVCNNVYNNGKQECKEEIYYKGLCYHHYKIVDQVEKDKIWKRAILFHDTHVFCKSDWKYTIIYGTFDIYYYISKSKLGNRSIDKITKEDCDTEVHIEDDIWKYSGPLWEFFKNKNKNK
jgi:hypothetical protein